jgi:hypothetical protein
VAAVPSDHQSGVVLGDPRSEPEVFDARIVQGRRVEIANTVA